MKKVMRPWHRLPMFAIQIVLILGVFMSLPACSESRGWIKTWGEEVQLHDERVIVVGQKRLCERTRGETDSCIEREAWLTIKLPELGNQEIVWHEKLSPMILNVYQGNLYIVGTPPTGAEFDLYGKPRPIYIGYLYKDSKWSRLPFKEIPEAIYDTNLVIDGGLLKTKFLTIKEKNSSEVNGDVGYPKAMKRIDPNFKNNY